MFLRHSQDISVEYNFPFPKRAYSQIINIKKQMIKFLLDTLQRQVNWFFYIKLQMLQKNNKLTGY